jgi:hypothetical protein
MSSIANFYFKFMKAFLLFPFNTMSIFTKQFFRTTEELAVTLKNNTLELFYSFLDIFSFKSFITTMVNTVM